MIYLDYASTTPIDPEVKKAMMPFFEDRFGNPSSTHFLGQETRVAIDNSRQIIADFLGCGFTEVYFMSGATEANNLAIKGLTQIYADSNADLRGKLPHIITSRIEHKSVLKPIESLARRGMAEVTYLPVNKNGTVKIENLKKEIKESTVLVSIMYVNNETGVVQPVREIEGVIKKRRLENKSQYPLFHIDAVQAVNYLPVNVKDLNCDLLSLSSHKIYGPKGVGVLYIKEGTKISPLIDGGGQENGMRAGTENVAGIVGMGKAIELLNFKNNKTQITNYKQNTNNKLQITNTTKLRDYLEAEILKNIKNTSVNGSSSGRASHISNILFKGMEAELLIILLDQEGIMVSSGSACQAKAIEPSYVLMAMGLSKKDAMSSVRFSLGRNTTKEEIDRVLKILPGMIAKLRR